MRCHQILGLLCFLFFLHSSLSFALPLCPPDQRDALLHFRNSSFDDMTASCISITGHIPEPNKWNLSVDCCSWYGVTCDDVTGNIISLDLTCNWLSGTIYSNSSLHLPDLEVLVLKCGNLTKFPYFLNSLNRLKVLDLSSNRISGEIPRWFWGISHDTLESLDLSKNLLEGSIPQFHWKRLSFICIANNAFQGPLPIPTLSTSYFDASNNGFMGKIPSLICQLSSLQSLDLSNNNLTGNMPPCFGNMTKLRTADLSSNNFQWPLPIPSPLAHDFRAFNNGFTGEIPYAICQLSSVEYLDLSINNLSGNMPSCFGNMTNLLNLDLSMNKLQGQLPRSLVKCTNLQTLSLSHNKFSDIFPHWLEVLRLSLHLQSNKFYGRINSTAFELSFSSLSYLFISNNNFIGQWPTEVFLNTSLSVIDLSNNEFGGSIPLPSPVTSYYSIKSNKITGNIPSLICNATLLNIVDLSNNSLTGSLPLCLTNFSTDLSVLNLRMNHLWGTIPRSFSLSNGLTTLDLSQNQFEGTLPRSLVKCKDLEVLDLSDNQIEDTFPSWLGILPELKVLILRSNNFKGLLNKIPKGAHVFSKLHILDLSNNNFGGPLPANLIMNLKAMMNGENGQAGSLYMTNTFSSASYENSVIVTMKGQKIELVKILTFLTIIDLSHNSFQGNIPGVIGHLHSLIGLNLSHNQFRGSIPPTLGNLIDLGWLDLSSNKLSGGIPRVLGDLASLGRLDLSKNQLTGYIPQDKQLSTFSSDSFNGNPGLCGTPLPKACHAPPPPPPSLPTFDREGHESWFKQKVMWIGYAAGIIIGMSIAYIAFETGRPEWIAQGVIMLERRAAKWMEKPKWKAIKFHGQ